MATFPGGLFTETDVTAGQTLGGASPTHRVRENAIKAEVEAIEAELGINPADLDATETVTATPTTVKQKTDVLARRIADIVGTFTGSVSLTMATLAGKFDASTGHTHTGAAGDAPKADAGKLQGRALSSAAPSLGDVVGWDGSNWEPTAPGGGGGGGAGTIVIEELDGTPTGDFDTLKFPNGTLTDNMDGSATYTPAGGGGAGTITIEEADGTPTGSFDKLILPNGTLTDNMDGSATYTPAGGGGGGGGLSYGTLASRPAAGTAGAAYQATDAPYLFIDNGVTWDAYFQGRKVRCPSDITMAWVNQTFGGQSGAVDVTRGYARLSRQVTGSGQICARAWTHGLTAPWRQTVIFDFSGPDAHSGGTSCGFFIGFRDSVGGKLIIMQGWMELNQFRLDYLNSPTSFNTNQVGGNNWTSYDRLGPLYGFTLEDDATNLAVELTTPMNAKGRKYYSAGRTSFLANAPDQLIFGIFDNSTSGELAYTTLYGIADA